MIDNRTIAAILILKKLGEPLTAEEEAILADFVADPAARQAVDQIMLSKTVMREPGMFTLSKERADQLYEKLNQTVLSQSTDKQFFEQPDQVIDTNQKVTVYDLFSYVRRHWVAAVLVIGASILTWWATSRSGDQNTVAKTDSLNTIRPDSSGSALAQHSTENKSDSTLLLPGHFQVSHVAPGTVKAELIFSDSRRIVWDSTTVQRRFRHNDADWFVRDGQLVYTLTGNARDADLKYNILQTPRGGSFRMRLPDGTQVWLNAGSSISFPLKFSDTSRMVVMSGEVYFDVASQRSVSAKKPFVVVVKTSRGEQINEVLGTRFNVMAYEDEPAVTTSVVEGEVLVFPANEAKRAVTLHAGEAVNIYDNEKISVNSQAHIDSILAWKNGNFYFNQTDLKTIMRQIGRWYNVDVHIDADVPNETYSGEIPRNTPLATVLAALKFSGLNIRGDEKKITIKKMPTTI